MIVDLFAGPGGWSEGLRSLGLSDVGVEWDAAACATRSAAQHRTIRADVTAMPAGHLRERLHLLIGSPPCTAFSMAGKGAGREVIDELSQAMYRGDWLAMRNRHPMVVWAPLDVGRWIEESQPTLIALEQVPPCLVLWQALAHWLRDHGWHVAARTLNAADYGVPQTRERAFLIASRLGPVALPEPTHERTPVDSLFGTRERWISMAEALGWPMSVEVVGRRGAGMIERHGEREATPATEPYPTVTSGAHRRHWVVDRRTNSRGPKGTSVPTAAVPMTQPAPTFTAKSGQQWVFERPSTTIVGSFSPDIVAAPGYRKPGDPPRQNTPGSVKITVEEALVIQSFDRNYPLQGSKTKKFEQVGNAVPPLLAAHVLAALTGRELEAAA